jgi:hypothetical protein
MAAFSSCDKNVAVRRRSTAHRALTIPAELFRVAREGLAVHGTGLD